MRFRCGFRPETTSPQPVCHTKGKLAVNITVADDSGLEVDALRGRPGVRTKRFAPSTKAYQREITTRWSV